MPYIISLPPSLGKCAYTNTTPPSSAQDPPLSSTTTAVEQQALSIASISAYIAHPTASHVQHRHRSAQQAEASHATDMKAYLDDFDATIAKNEK